MTRPMRPPRSYWLVCGVTLAAGVGLFGVYLFDRFYGTTPEDELTPAEGVPADLERTAWAGHDGLRTDFITFTVGGYRTQHASDRPGYPEVLAAVEGGDHVRVWVSTRRETLLPRRGWVPLYKLDVGDTPVVTYSDRAGENARRGRGLLGLAGVVTATGGWGLFRVARVGRRAAAVRADRRT